MATYSITFFTAKGEVCGRQILYCRTDDEVIDRVGASAHPHAIKIVQGERTVVDFPPLSQRRSAFGLS
jgi:hypothetical protein